eukprot:1097059-Prymnesium_polylepis.2
MLSLGASAGCTVTSVLASRAPCRSFHADATKKELQDNLAVLGPVGVVAQLGRRQVAVALDLGLSCLHSMIAMGDCTLEHLLTRVEGLDNGAGDCMAQIALIAAGIARLDDVPAQPLLPQRRDGVTHSLGLTPGIERHHLWAQAPRPDMRKAAAQASLVKASLLGVVAQVLGADELAHETTLRGSGGEVDQLFQQRVGLERLRLRLTLRVVR